MVSALQWRPCGLAQRHAPGDSGVPAQLAADDDEHPAQQGGGQADWPWPEIAVLPWDAPQALSRGTARRSWPPKCSKPLTATSGYSVGTTSGNSPGPRVHPHLNARQSSRRFRMEIQLGGAVEQVEVPVCGHRPAMQDASNNECQLQLADPAVETFHIAAEVGQLIAH